MGFSMLTKIIREDFISSLTGGFYLEYQQSHFVNIAHLYLWILFLIFPLIVYLVCPDSVIGGLTYSVSIAVTVASIKFITWRLHRLLDSKEPINKPPPGDDQHLLSKSNIPAKPNDSALLERILDDPDYEEVSATFVQDIEERCRRIGQAGLAMAELNEVLKSDRGLVMCPFSTVLTDTGNPFSTPNNPDVMDQPLAVEEKCLTHKHALTHTISSPTNVVISELDQEPSTSTQSTRKSNSETNNEVTNNYGLIAVDSRNPNELSGARKKSIIFKANRTSISPHKVLHTRSPMARRVPARRQLSSTAALLFPTEPGCSNSSVIGADIDRCKRIITQLEADVSRLPVRLDEPFTPSLKDLEALNSCSQKSIGSTHHGRSHSQRHHHALLAPQSLAVRQPAVHVPGGVFARQTIGPVELTELSLADTMLYWRRHFTPNSIRANRKRAVRSQSVRQPGFSLNRSCRMDTEVILNRHMGRSHSLRCSHSFRTQLSTGYRHPPRRPGSALRLKEQKSIDSALTSRSNVLTTPECGRLTSTDSPFRRKILNVGELSKGPSEDRNGGRRMKAAILKAPSADSESITPATGVANNSNSSANISLESRQLTTNEPDEISVVNSVAALSDDPVAASVSDSADDSITGLACEPTSKLPVNTRSPRFLRRTGLVRQYCIRRKFTIVPTHTGDSVLVSDSSEVVGHLSGKTLTPEQTNTNSVMREEPKSEAGSSSTAIEQCSSPSVPVPSTPIPSGSSTSTNKTVDILLAQLMGVQSLADAGLTRQQCLTQLRGGLDSEDSENAELDILFALTAAATNTDEHPTRTTTKVPSDFETETVPTRISEDTEQHSEHNGQPLQQDEPVAGPSTSLLQTIPPCVNRNANPEHIGFTQDDSDDVPVSLIVETSSPNRSRQSFSLTRPFFRARPLNHTTRVQAQPKQVYVIRPFRLLPFTARLRIDRLQLDSLFDRNRSVIELILSVILSLLVGLEGICVLQTGIYRDLSVLFLCFAIAGSHYSLIKSVQPDAASPQHGFNRVIVYSRSIFFCILSLLFILTARFHDIHNVDSAHSSDTRSTLFHSTSLHTGELDFIDQTLFSVESPLLAFESIPYRMMDAHPVVLYHVNPLDTRTDPAPERELPLALNMPSSQVELFGSLWSLEKLAHFVHNVTSQLLVIFPLLFLFGLVPQMNTALTYILEQVDIHVFGGSGTTNLWSVCFSILRALIAYGITFWFCLAAIETNDPYHYLFSTFWALQISLCFLLSRLPSNLSLYATLFPHSLNGDRFRQQLRLLVHELLHFSCFPRLKHKSSVGVSTTNAGLKRRCRPRWPWSKTRKPKVSATGVTTLEPVVWWRTWLPLLSNVGAKSTPGLSTAQSGVTERLLAQPTYPLGDVPASPTPFPLSAASTCAGRSFRSFSFNELTKTGEEKPPASIRRASNTRVDRVLTGGSLPTVSVLTEPSSSRCMANLLGTQGSHFSACNPEARLHVKSSSISSHLSSHRDSNRSLEGENTPTEFFVEKTDILSTDVCPGGSGSGTDVNCLTEQFQAKLAVTATSNPPESIQHRSSTQTEYEASSTLKHPGVPHSTTDPLPGLIRTALTGRLKNDLNCCVVWLVTVFVLHISPLLKYATMQPIFPRVVLWTVVFCGTFLHYLWPNLRKNYPWLCLARPPIAPHANGELIRWETGYYWFCWIERNVLVPLLTVLTITNSVTPLLTKFGPFGSTTLILLTSMKMLRNGFSAPGRVFITLFFTDLLFTFDFHQISETLPLNYFFVSIMMCKVIELIRKLHFVYIYTAPFRITCGSVFHAIAQIGFIPHAVFVLGNCVLSTILSSPLEPFLASAVFLTSYVRPIKFWEVEHCTERMETTNTSLASQLRGTTVQQVMLNSNAIFYERLSRNLQLTLAGDIQLGRLGGLTISHGDVFILSSDELNLVIHIIEVGNGLVTFQLRGLEVVGTFCHDHETEALHQTSYNDNGFCCCNPGHYPGFLSLNAALRMRCITWQFIYGSYCVEGYRMSSHSADTVVQLNDLRKVLVTRFVQCIIYYVTKLPNLSERLSTLSACLQTNNFFSESHFDLDPVFMRAIDEDYDDRVNGVTRRRFVRIYQSWISFCLEKRSLPDTVTSDSNSPLVSLCYALSILGRRCMGGVQTANFDVSQVLRGIHDIFKGDIHVLTKDDWVLTDLELLQTVVTPAMRIALKLYQDNFIWASEMTHAQLYSKIVYTEENFVICHETDPQWRFAVLNDAHKLFSFRLMGMDSDNVYRFVQLTKGKLNFSAVKINPECVRGLWAGQQREQIFIRNTNQERGSIQGAQHVLRNLVNSSCDPPIGYPIYVSPLLTSFTDTNPLYTQVAGPWFSFTAVFQWLRTHLVRLFTYHRSVSTNPPQSGDKGIELTTRPQSQSPLSTSQRSALIPSCNPSIKVARDIDPDPWPSFSESYESVHQKNVRNSGSGQFTTLAALVHHQYESDVANTTGLGANRASLPRPVRVRIVNVSQILNDKLNKLSWPSEEWRTRCLTLSTCLASVYAGLEGETVHRWTPSNPDATARSFCHRTIRLIGFPGGPPLLDGHFVAIFDEGVIELSGLGDATASSSSAVTRDE